MAKADGWLGRVLDGAGEPAGTCFQVRPGVLVTAWHVLVEVDAENEGALVLFDELGLDLSSSVTPRSARVLKVDPVHDIAVLRCDIPLRESVSSLSATDAVTIGESVLVTGHAVVQDPAATSPIRHLDAPGTWAGGMTRDDGLALGVVDSSSVMPGMSGSPVVRLADRAVLGMVSGRYNTVDGWLRDTVWVVRTEDLEPLLNQVEETADLALTGAPPVTGAVNIVLAIDQTTVRLQVPGRRSVAAPHAGVSPSLEGAVHDVRRARARAGGQARHQADPAAPGSDVTSSLRRAGQLLAISFLPQTVATELRDLIQGADASSMPVRVGIEVAPAAAPLSLLPWEALPDPLTGRPLALHRLVSVYRRTPPSVAGSAGAARVLGGPLRIVVAIAAPTSGMIGGVLDYEQELRTVIRAVNGARASGAARVQVVPFATTAAIHQALSQGDVHVLHLSGHGAPGVLVLEDEHGNAREVTAQEFLDEAVPVGKMPPVIALAACYTNVPTGTDPNDAAAASFAQDLVTHGAAAVIATETSVTDRYATRVFSRVYQTLAAAATRAAARGAAPSADGTTVDAVEAVAHARRVVQAELETSSIPLDTQLALLDEWGVVSVLSADCVAPVLDPTAPPAPDRGLDPATRTFGGLIGRDPGEFVGRRIEQRLLPPALTGASIDGVTHHGVLLRGIGGIGKTTLAAEVLRRALEQQPGRVVVSITGETGVEQILTETVDVLKRHLLRAGQAGSPQMQALNLVANSDLRWNARFEELREQVLDVVPLLLVLDNFEDNLAGAGGTHENHQGLRGAASVDEQAADGQGTKGVQLEGRRATLRTVRDDSLAAMLGRWLTTPGASRLLITCRHPFALPQQAERGLWDRPLGPLTRAETQKLAWVLPRIDALGEDDIDRIWRLIGGHPRTLEYVDALLAGGQGRLPDITARLEDKVTQALKAQTDDWRDWLSSKRTLDAALADAVTVAADDVLLPELLEQISVVPYARQALIGLSVFREPVDINALLFQIGIPDEASAWNPDRDSAQQHIDAVLDQHHLDHVALDTALGSGSLASLPPDAVTELMPHLRERYAQPRPPRRLSPDIDINSIIQVLTDSTLLTQDPDAGTLFVHRWTADELARIEQSRQGSGAVDSPAEKPGIPQ